MDFSNLNRKKKDITDAGESGQTFEGILSYVAQHRPPLVVLENIKHAPWDKIVAAWQGIGYLSRHVIVDTKNYYLPQTRARGYMLCIDRARVKDEHGDVLDRWVKTFGAFKRSASSPFAEFLIPEDETAGVRKVGRAIGQPLESRSQPDWSSYRIRHQDYRRTNQLGYRRPVTNFREGGLCRPIDWMDRSWFNTQPERVLDTIDADFLYALLHSGYDNRYKL